MLLQSYASDATCERDLYLHGFKYPGYEPCCSFDHIQGKDMFTCTQRNPSYSYPCRHGKYYNSGVWLLLPICLWDLFLQHQLWPFLNKVKPLWLIAGLALRRFAPPYMLGNQRPVTRWPETLKGQHLDAVSRLNFLWYLIISLLKSKTQFLPHSRSMMFLLLISHLAEAAPELVVGICQYRQNWVSKNQNNYELCICMYTITILFSLTWCQFTHTVPE